MVVANKSIFFCFLVIRLMISSSPPNTVSHTARLADLVSARILLFKTAV